MLEKNDIFFVECRNLCWLRREREERSKFSWWRLIVQTDVNHWESEKKSRRNFIFNQFNALFTTGRDAYLDTRCFFFNDVDHHCDVRIPGKDLAIVTFARCYSLITCLGIASVTKTILMNEKERRRKRARWERQWRQTRCISSFWWIFSPHVCASFYIGHFFFFPLPTSMTSID